MISKFFNFAARADAYQSGGPAFTIGNSFGIVDFFEARFQAPGITPAFEQFGFTVRYLEGFQDGFFVDQNLDTPRASSSFADQELDLDRFTDRGGVDKFFDAGTDGVGFDGPGVLSFVDETVRTGFTDGFDWFDSVLNTGSFSGGDDLAGAGLTELSPALVSANLFLPNIGIFGDLPRLSPENLDFFDGNI